MISGTGEFTQPATVRRLLSMRHLILLLLVGVALALSPASAGATGTGTISGNLTDSSGRPAKGVCVTGYDSNGDAVNGADSDSNGHYILPGIETGDYRVGFFSCADANVLDEYYDDSPTLSQATRVAATGNADIPGIDAVLAVGGSISGRVTVAPNGPNGGICVRAWKPDGRDWKGTVTDSNGNYSIVGLKTVTYRVQFTPCDAGSNVLGEYYSDRQGMGGANLVPVKEGSDTPGINARLVTGGTISGVVASGLNVVAEVCSMTVTAYDSGGGVAGSYTFSSYAGGSVSYTIDGLRTGTYRLGFAEGCLVYPSFDTATASGFYNGKDTLPEATPVSVTEGSSRTGINMFADGGGRISGEVTDVNGGPLKDVCIQAYDEQGNPGSEGRTSADGTFVINQFTTGQYRLGFHGCDDAGPTSLVPEFYDDKETLAEAVPVPVQYGAETSGIDVQLARTILPVVHRAAIGKVVVKGPMKLKKGRNVNLRVKITNSGNAGADGVKLRIRGRGLSFRTSVGSIPAGATRTVIAGMRPKRPGRARLTFRVTSSNAGGRSVVRNVLVMK